MVGEAGQDKVANVSAEIDFHSWRPIVKPGVEVLPSDFPLVRVPSSLGPIGHGLIGLEYDMHMDCDRSLDAVSLSSSVINENMEDVPEYAYPKLYLLPQLLHPPRYMAAAMAAKDRRKVAAGRCTLPIDPGRYPSNLFRGAWAYGRVQ